MHACNCMNACIPTFDSLSLSLSLALYLTLSLCLSLCLALSLSRVKQNAQVVSRSGAFRLPVLHPFALQAEIGNRMRAKREQIKSFQGPFAESQGQNLALNVLYPPYSLGSGDARNDHSSPFVPSIKSHFWKISSTFGDK